MVGENVIIFPRYDDNTIVLDNKVSYKELFASSIVDRTTDITYISPPEEDENINNEENETKE